MVTSALGKMGEGMSFNAARDRADFDVWQAMGRPARVSNLNPNFPRCLLNRVCIVAVDQASGAFGVGFCPGSAMAQLTGFVGIGEVHYFISFGAHPVVKAKDSGGFSVVDGMPIERVGGCNDIRQVFLKGASV